MCLPCTMCNSYTDGVGADEKGVFQKCGVILRAGDTVCPQCFVFLGIGKLAGDNNPIDSDLPNTEDVCEL